MFPAIALVLGAGIVATRPWAGEDREWFAISALLEAMLLGGVLLSIV